MATPAVVAAGAGALPGPTPLAGLPVAAPVVASSVALPALAAAPAVEPPHPFMVTTASALSATPAPSAAPASTSSAAPAPFIVTTESVMGTSSAGSGSVQNTPHKPPGPGTGVTPSKRAPSKAMTATDLSPTYNLTMTTVTGYSDNDGNEYKLMEPPLTSVLLEFGDFSQHSVHSSKPVAAQTRDNDWRCSLEVVTTAKGTQHLNVTVALCPPPDPATGEPAAEFPRTFVRRCNAVVELLHRDSTMTSSVSAWRGKDADIKVPFGWRTFDASNGWAATVENVTSLRQLQDQYLVAPGDTLIVRFKFYEYERGTVETWRDETARKNKERLNGYAECTYKNGNQYVGAWVRGRQHGSGAFTHARPAPSKYVGQFEEGIRHGRGEFTFADHTRYAGMWKAGQQHGPGRWYFANDSGSVEGEWVEGKMIRGRGQYLNVETGAQYVGGFGPGMKRNGDGTLTALDGTRVSGVWKDNVLTGGYGTRVLENGGTYTGDMSLEERGKQLILFPNGHGRIEFPQNGGALTGEWKDSVFLSGRGLRRYRLETPTGMAIIVAPGAMPQPTVMVSTVSYEGEFAGPEILRNGHGTLRNGDHHMTGEWKNDSFISGRGSRDMKEGVYYGGLRGAGGVEAKREGMGMFLFRYSAQVFIGYWKDDTMFHSGMARYNTGGSFWGYWLAGRVHGCGVFEWPHQFRTSTLREYTEGKMTSEIPTAVEHVQIGHFKHSIICSSVGGMGNPIAGFFSQPLSVIAQRTRVEATEYEALIGKVIAALRSGTVDPKKSPLGAVERVVRAGALSRNTLAANSLTVSLVVVLSDFQAAQYDSYLTAIAERLEHVFAHRVFRHSRTHVTIPLPNDIVVDVAPGGQLDAASAPTHFLALTPPHRDLWAPSVASLVAALIRPLTHAEPKDPLPLYAHLVRVAKAWVAAVPFSSSSEPSPLLIELMCLQICGGSSRGLPIDAPSRTAAAASAAAAAATAPKSYHIRAGGVPDLNVAFRQFLHLCTALDTQRVFWDAYYGRKQIPTYYADRRDEVARADVARAMNTYEAASSIVLPANTTVGSGGGGASAGSDAKDGAGGVASVAEPVTGNVVYLHPVIPTLNVAESLTDCAPIKQYALFSLSLLEVYTDVDTPTARGVGLYNELADWKQQSAANAAARAAVAESDTKADAAHRKKDSGDVKSAAAAATAAAVVSGSTLR